MKLFINSKSCEYDGGHFNSITNDIYSIDVQDYITINTLAHIIKDKENMTEHNFESMRLISSGELIYPLSWSRDHSERYSILNKLNDDSHIYIIFRVRG